MGSYIDAITRLRARRAAAVEPLGLLDRRRNLGRGRVAEDVLVEHAARDGRGRGAVLAVLDEHSHGDLRIVRRREAMNQP